MQALQIRTRLSTSGSRQYQPWEPESVGANPTVLTLPLSAKLQAMHQDIGMVKETYHHKDLGDLGIGISELLHGSGVELQSGFTVV